MWGGMQRCEPGIAIPGPCAACCCCLLLVLCVPCLVAFAMCVRASAACRSPCAATQLYPGVIPAVRGPEPLSRARFNAHVEPDLALRTVSRGRLFVVVLYFLFSKNVSARYCKLLTGPVYARAVTKL